MFGVVVWRGGGKTLPGLSMRVDRSGAGGVTWVTQEHGAPPPAIVSSTLDQQSQPKMNEQTPMRVAKSNTPSCDALR